MVMADRKELRTTHVLAVGAYDNPLEAVHAATPPILPPLRKPAEPANRLDLARWLVSRDHPLTARVTVNRLWQEFFGIGLIKTPEDFGVQSEIPVHPELLDWLAADFMERGWDFKRSSVTSSPAAPIASLAGHAGAASGTPPTACSPAARASGCPPG